MPNAIAFFDLDGTVITCSSEKALYRRLTAEKGRWFQCYTAVLWLCRTLYGLLTGEALYDALRNRYYLTGVSWQLIEQLAMQLVKEQLAAAVAPSARERMQWHQQQGHRIVLVSATLQPIVEAMACCLPVDDVVACVLPLDLHGRVRGTEKGGRIPRRRGKVALVAEYAAQYNADLADCWGYGNTLADAYFMQVCGHAMAVNADRGLQALAQQEGWPQVVWDHEQSDTQHADS